MDLLYLLTGIAVMLATMTTLYYTIARQDRIWDRDFGNYDNDGTLRV